MQVARLCVGGEAEEMTDRGAMTLDERNHLGQEHDLNASTASPSPPTPNLLSS